MRAGTTGSGSGSDLQHYHWLRTSRASDWRDNWVPDTNWLISTGASVWLRTGDTGVVTLWWCYQLCHRQSTDQLTSFSWASDGRLQWCGVLRGRCRAVVPHHTPQLSSAAPGHSLGHRRGVTVATRKKASHPAAPHSTNWRLTIKVSTCPKCNYCWTLVRGEWGQVWRLALDTGQHYYQRKLSREWHDTCNDLPYHQILRSDTLDTPGNTWDLTFDW